MPTCAYEPGIGANICEWLKRGNSSVCYEDSVPTVRGGPEGELLPPAKTGVRISKQNHILEHQTVVISLQGGTHA